MATIKNFDWKGAIGQVAPWLAATLGGPAAGLAVDALCSALGLEATPENAQKAAAMAAAKQLSGDQFLALQAAEAGHRERMQALGYRLLTDLENIAYQDRDSARQREIKTGDSWTPRILAVVVMGGWLGIQWFLLRNVVPQENRELISRGLGTFDLAVGLVLGYYYGSSSGSSRKTDMLANNQKGTP